MRLPRLCFIPVWLLLVCVALNSARAANSAVIHSGVAWFDQHGNTVSARGAGIVKDGERYYLFGEFKQDRGNAFSGFSCYSSADLVNWKFERLVLPMQPDGRAGPDRVGERPKVLKCPTTGEYVLFFHSDDARYKDPAVAYATSPTIDGEYTFRGPLLFDGQPIKKWDMSVFQDDDGAGYLVTHSGNLFKLARDYKSVVTQVVRDMTKGHESPAIFKRHGLYYWLGSGLTAWERNDNDYYTATSLAGPWTHRGHFAPTGSLTWNSQTTFVLPIVGDKTTTWMFLGDRWAHPYQNSAATYVWQPLAFDAAGNLSLPQFHSAWQIDLRSGQWLPIAVAAEGKLLELSALGNRLRHSPEWTTHTDQAGFTDLRADAKDASLSFTFTGTRVGLHSVARPDGGFGRVEIKDAHGKIVVSTIIETYCLYAEASLKFLSPSLPRGTYTVTVTPLGERFFWQAKTRTYGSNGNFVSVQKVLIVD